jgi:hypothetical protein
MTAGVTARFCVGSEVFVVVVVIEVVVDEVVVVVLTAEGEPQAASKRAVASTTGPAYDVRFINTPQFAAWSQCNSTKPRTESREVLQEPIVARVGVTNVSVAAANSPVSFNPARVTII